MDMGYTLMLWVVVYMLRHVTHYYLIIFVKGLSPRVSEAQCGYTSLHEYVITTFENSMAQVLNHLDPCQYRT